MILPSGWLVLLRLYLPASAQHFTGDDLLHHSAPRFRPGNPQKLTQEIQVCPEHTESQALASCKFLTLEEDQYLAGYVRLPNPYLVGYFLAKLWERDFKDEGSVITESIVNHNGACSCPRCESRSITGTTKCLKPTASLNSDGLCLLSGDSALGWTACTIGEAYDSDR